MNIRYNYNLAGDERKAFVQAVSETLGKPAVYQRAPTFAYAIDSYTVDKTGALSCHEDAELAAMDRLIFQLRERGYAPEPTAFTIEVSRTGFSEEGFENLQKIVASKSSLIKKAIGADSLGIEATEETLRFPWFTLRGEEGEVDACLRLVHALCEMAKRQKRVTAKEHDVVNEKFAMRVFLIRLGFIGDEYSTAGNSCLKTLLATAVGKRDIPQCRMRQTSVLRGFHSLLLSQIIQPQRASGRHSGGAGRCTAAPNALRRGR